MFDSVRIFVNNLTTVRMIGTITDGDFFSFTIPDTLNLKVNFEITKGVGGYDSCYFFSLCLYSFYHCKIFYSLFMYPDIKDICVL